MIKSSKEFRKLVVETEDAFRRNSLNGAFVVLDEIQQSVSPVRAVKLCTLIERVIKNRLGILTFEDSAKINLKMRLKLIEQQDRNRIRKQEEAPEALAVDGAESSSDFVCIECVHCGSVDGKELLNTIHGLVCRDCLGA
ncbi:hypothetical protein [Vibrio vulnificus]|uniref:hypothetical protein n=1 Tax=Vibrio vulnificus TaxID=672 RepID=UPI001FAFBB3A|nr:hypothetical protein [Vibrio vulnificus]MCJ0813252.1 hypothetical protein [Vibrio vulnificus]